MRSGGTARTLHMEDALSSGTTYSHPIFIQQKRHTPAHAPFGGLDLLLEPFDEVGLLGAVAPGNV